MTCEGKDHDVLGLHDGQRPEWDAVCRRTQQPGRRAWEHRTKALDGFSARYDVVRLVWYEPYADIRDAITREKALKKWCRAWKLKLIEDMNPEWDDLYLQLNM